MNEESASATAELTALLRAAHQILEPAPRILEDPVAVGLVAKSSRDEILASREQLQSSFLRVLRASFVIRSRVTEDALEEAVRNGVGQYVVLGAGFDTFAYRQPAWAQGLRIIELDHPATQNAKRDRLAGRSIAVPENTTLAAIDFEEQSIGAVLEATPFDPKIPTFFSWLGVIPYLTQSAIDETLIAIRDCATQVAIALSFILPDEELAGADAKAVQISTAAAAARGEPWLTRFTPKALEQHLQSLAYAKTQHVDPAQFQLPDDALPAPNFEHLIIAHHSS